MNAKPSSFAWQRIAPLTDSDRAIDLAAMPQLYDTWRTAKERLQGTSPSGLLQFNQRLVRRLSVETGILERLYDLDRGTTEALVAKGFVEDLVSRASTNIEPANLIDILRSQEAAIQLVIDCVAGSRQLTKSVVHELHAILTAHQATTTAVDQLGNRTEILLRKGAYKTHPNNPKRQDGSFHEYCPVVHVESEMDNLLTWLDGYGNEDPIVVSAWLHHRFTQIHPYQDGNGRVARALTTYSLLKANLLPLVVDRDLRVEYIGALEAADAGDLSPLALIFARLERGAILQALSIDADAEISRHRSVTTAVLESLKDKFEKRREAKFAKLREVNEVAFDLRALARKELESSYTELGRAIRQVSQAEINIIDGGPDRNNSHWYKFEVVKSAQEAGKFANFSEAHYFIKASIRADRERLVFVVSLHHVGHELSGVMEATAFARLESYEHSDDRELVSQDFFLCSTEPFVFTYATKEAKVRKSFSSWLDTAIAVAFKQYGDRL